MKDAMQRHPRPQGATLLSTKYRETGEELDREALYRHLVTIYTTSGFRWNGIPTSIPDLSVILQIPQHEIMTFVSQAGAHMGNLADPKNIKNTLQTIITLSTSFALEDRGLIMQQLETLLSSQNGKYRPFITGEVNKVLKLVLDSNKNLADIYKTFTSSTPTTNILNIFGETGQSDNGEDYLTTDDAVRMLNDPNNKSLLQQNKDIQDVEPLSNTENANHEPSLPTQTKSPADTAHLAKSLSEKYGIAGDFEDFGGPAEALEHEGPPPPGPEAEELKSPKKKPKKRDDGGFKRRAIELSDEDNIS